ncbi:MAG TPA: MFS transporter, partial [Thermoplasmata archaeon]
MTDPEPLPTVENGDAAAPPRTEPVLTRAQSAGVLVALLMGLLLGALDNFIVVTALPVIAKDLN